MIDENTGVQVMCHVDNVKKGVLTQEAFGKRQGNTRSGRLQYFDISLFQCGWSLTHCPAICVWAQTILLCCISINATYMRDETREKKPEHSITASSGISLING